MLLAADLWTGTGGNANWSTGANWLGGAAPRPGDDLVFPAGATQLSNTNDFSAGTAFNSLVLRGGGYAISGNAITLASGIVANNAAGANSVGLNLTLASSQSILDANAAAPLTLSGSIDTGNLLTLTFDGSGTTVLSNTVSGNGNLIKNGSGTVTLGGANSYTGTTTVNQGTVLITSNTALGNSANTIVNQGATLAAQGNLSVSAPLSLAGQGVGIGVDASGNGGALRVIGSGSSVTWSGGIGLPASPNISFIGVDQNNTLNITSQISSFQGATSGSLAKVGAGTLILSGSSSNIYTGTTFVLGGLLQLNKSNNAIAIPGNLNIGDQRNVIAGDATTGSAGATVQLLASNQIAPLDFWAVNVLTDTLFPSGKLDLNGFSNTVGNLTLWQGPSFSAQITTGAGTLQLEGNITLSTAEGTSAASPAATIAGKLDLGALFSGTTVNNSGKFHTLNILTTQLPGLEAPNLNISANVSGGAAYGMIKTGIGDLQLSGNNTYAGPTVIQQGMVDIGSDTAFGNGTGVVDFAGGGGFAQFIRATGGSHTLSNPLEIDTVGVIDILGTHNLTFSGDLTLAMLVGSNTGTHTINVFHPSQTTTFTGTVTESVYGTQNLTKGGEGTLQFSGAANYTGTTTLSADGGTLALKDNGTLLNTSSITLNQGATLKIDNSGSTNISTNPSASNAFPGRLNPAFPITLNNANLIFVGASSGSSVQQVGVLTTIGTTSSNVIESDTTGSGSSLLQLGGLSLGASATVNFAGGGTALSANGANEITFLPNLTAGSLPTLTNGVLLSMTVTDPGNTLDFATLAGGPNGVAIFALPANAYFTSLAAVPPTSTSALVKLTQNETTISKNVFGLIVGPGVVIIGQDNSTTLTVGSGIVGFSGSGGQINVPYLALSGATNLLYSGSPSSNSNTIASVVTGTTAINKAGAGKVILSGASQFSGALNINEGIINIQNSQALGSPAGGTNVNFQATLQVQDTRSPVQVTGEPLNLNGPGSSGNDYAPNGALEVVGGDNNSWTGSTSGAINFAISNPPLVDATALFPNANLATLIFPSPLTSGGFIAIDSGNFTAYSLTRPASMTLFKTGSGTLTMGGVLADPSNGNWAIKQGTVVMNRAPGVTSLGTETARAIVVGDDISGSAALVDMQSQQLPFPGTIATTVQVASNGTFTLGAALLENLTHLMLETGPLGSAGIQIGTGSTLALNGNISLQTLGSSAASGASITGGTLALNLYGSTGAAVTRTFLVNRGASSADDLTITSTITDGSGLINTLITKTGLGTLAFGGSSANTYSGLTTIQEGTLALAKPSGVLAIGGALTIGANFTPLAAGVVGNGAGWQNSAVVVLRNNNQLPGLTAPVTITGVGRLDLNNFNATIGANNFQNALTLQFGGSVTTGTGTLSLNGDISVTANTITNTPALPAVISGNLNIAGSGVVAAALRTFTVPAGTGVPYGLQIPANMSGDVSLRFSGAGNVLLSGNNTYTGDTFLQAGILALGSNTALGVGMLSWVGTILAENGARTLANRVSIDGNVTLGGGDDLTFSGAANITGARTFTVTNANTLTFGGGLGENIVANDALTKSGAGTLQFTSAATYSGATTVNAQGGTILLSGNGALLNTASISLATGTSLVLDNTSANIASGNRVRDLAAITLAASSQLAVLSNTSAATSEVLGPLTLVANLPDQIVLRSGNAGGTLAVTTPAITAPAGSMVNLIGQNSAIGSASNQFFVNVTAPTLVNGIWSFGWMTTQTAAGITDDFITVGNLAGTGSIAASGVSTATQSGTTVTITTSIAHSYIVGQQVLISGIATGGYNGLYTVTAITATTFTYTAAPALGASGSTANALVTGMGRNFVALSATSPNSANFRLNDFTGGATTNVKVTTSTAISGAAPVGGVLLDGRGINVSGSGTLTLAAASSGLLINASADKFYGASPASDNSVSVSTLSLGLNSTFVTDRGSTNTISSNIGGIFGLTVLGKGMLALSGNNGYTGATTVNEGVVAVLSNAALGTTAGATTVVAGAQLQIRGSGLTIAENITANATGLLSVAGVSDNSGALLNTGGNNTLTGILTGGSAYSIYVALGTILTNQAAFGLAGAAGITTVGPGTFKIANAGTGAVANSLTVNAGTVQLGATGGTAINGNITIGDNVGGASADVVQLLANNQTTATAVFTLQSTGKLDLNGFNLTTTGTPVFNVGPSSSSVIDVNGGNLTLNNVTGFFAATGLGGAPVAVSIIDSAGTGSFTPNATSTFTITDSPAVNDFLISAKIVGAGNISKATAGSRLSITNSANTNSGTTTVTLGELLVGSGVSLGSTSTIANGASLLLVGGAALSGSITVSGIGVGGAGAIRSLSGNNSIAGQITMAANTTYGVNTGSTLTLGGSLTSSGTFSLTKLLGGTLVLGSGSSDLNANSYIGATVVAEGTLQLNKSNGTFAIGAGSAITVGNDAGGPGSDVLQLLNANQISSSNSITVASGGLFDLNGNSQNLGATLTVQPSLAYGADVEMGAGTLSLIGGAAINTSDPGLGSFTAFSPPALINGKIDLGGSARTFTVASISAANNPQPVNILEIGAQITGSGGLIKAGAGTLQLSNGSNNYTGTSAVQQLFFSGASGTFTLGLFGVFTGPIAYDSNGTNLQSNIQAALDALLGANAVTALEVDPTTVLVIFGGSLGFGKIDYSNTALPQLSNTSPTLGTLAITPSTAGVGTAVNAGILALSASGAASNIPIDLSGGTIRADGGAVQLSNELMLLSFPFNTTTPIFAGDKPLTLSGLLVNFANNGTGLAINSSNSGGTTLSGGIQNSQSLTFNNAINASITVTGVIDDTAIGQTISGGRLTKIGLGNLNLTTANTYHGTTTVSAGVIGVRNSQALGVTTSTTQTFFVSSTPGNGVFNLTFNGAQTSSLAFSGTTAPSAAVVAAALNNLPSLLSSGTSVQVSQPSAGNYTVIFTGSLAGFDQPTFTVNTVTAPISVGAQTNSSITIPQNVTVAAGAAIELQSSGLNITKGLVLNGFGFTNLPTGAVRLNNINVGSGDTALLSGVISLTTAAGTAIAVDGAEDTLSLGAAGNTAGAGFVTGAGNLTKSGLGTLELGGTSTNTYSGGTNVNSGVLLLNKQTVAAYQFQPNATGTSNGTYVLNANGTSAGNVVVGSEGGSAVLRWGPDANVDQVYGLSSLSVNSSGVVDLATNNKSDWINLLSLRSGRNFSSAVQTGTGSLTVNNDVLVNTVQTGVLLALTNTPTGGYGVTDGNSPAVSISGTLNLTGALGQGNNGNVVQQQFVVNSTFIPSLNSVFNITGAVNEITPTYDAVTGGLYLPGLREGFNAGSTGAGGVGLTAPIGSITPQVYPRVGEQNNLMFVNNQTWDYNGQIFINTTRTISWGANINSASYVAIDGTVVVNQISTGSAAGSITLTAGWHNIDIRVGSLTAANGGAAAANGWLTTFGVGYAPFGSGGLTSGTAYTFPLDNGSQNLFRAPFASNDVPFTKIGNGTMDVSGSIGLTGSMNVQAGQLIINGTAAYNVLPSALQTVSFSGTPTSGTFVLSLGSVPITAATEVGTTATLTVNSNTQFSVGQSINVSGVPVPGYNGIFTVTAVNTLTDPITHITTMTVSYTAGASGLVNSSSGAVASATAPIPFTAATSMANQTTMAMAIQNALNQLSINPSYALNGPAVPVSVTVTPINSNDGATNTTSYAVTFGGGLAQANMTGISFGTQFVLLANSGGLTGGTVNSPATTNAIGGNGSASITLGVAPFVQNTVTYQGTTGTLLLDNRAINLTSFPYDGHVSTGRISSSAAVTLNNGNLQFIGNAAGTTQYVNAVTVGNGSTNTIQLTTNANPQNLAGTATLFQVTNAINRTAGGGGTVNFVGVSADLGTTSTTGNEFRIGSIVPITATTGYQQTGGPGAIIKAANESGNTVTLTVNSTSGFTVGQQIYVSQVTPSGYNGAYTLTGVTPTTFTYINPASGLAANPNATGSVALAVAAATQTTTQQAVTAATEIGTTAIITVGSTSGFGVGDQISVSGMTPSGYNGTYTITAQTATTVSYAVATSGLGNGTAFGIVTTAAVTLTVSSTSAFSVGDQIFVGDITPSGFNSSNSITGYWTIKAIPSGTTLQYADPFAAGLGDATTAGRLDKPTIQTLTFTGSPTGGTYTIAQSQSGTVAIIAATESGTTASITTAAPHGFVDGQRVVIGGITGPNTAAYNGIYTIAVTSPTTFTYSATMGGLTSPAGVIGATALNASNPITYSATSSTTNENNLQSALNSIYQPNTAVASFAGFVPIVSATESGTTVTITTLARNNFISGQSITLSGITGANAAGYNGVFTITVTSPTTFTYTAALGLTSPATVINANAGANIYTITYQNALGPSPSFAFTGNTNPVSVDYSALTGGIVPVGLYPNANPVPENTAGVLEFATVSGPAGLDLVTDYNHFFNDPGQFSVSRFLSYATDINSSAAVVKITTNSTLTAATTINGLLLAGGSINLNGNNLAIASGQILSTGGSISTSAGGTVNFGSYDPLLNIAGANQQQTVTISNTTSGSFTLSWQALGEYSGFAMPGGSGPLQTANFITTSLPFNATYDQVQAALEALPDIGANNVSVTGAAGGPYVITFKNALGGGNLPLLSVNSLLNSGATATVAVTSAGGGTTTLSVPLVATSAANRAMRKENLGTLVLAAANQFTTLPITIDQGILIIQNSLAVGIGSSVTVNFGAELDIRASPSNQVNVGNQPLILNGAGFLNNMNGSLHMLNSTVSGVGGTANWGTGATAITFNNVIGNVNAASVDAPLDTLTLNSTVTTSVAGTAAGTGFSVPLYYNQATTPSVTSKNEPAGTLIFAGTANNVGAATVITDGGTMILDKTGTNVFSMPGALTIGAGDGGFNNTVVKYSTHNGASDRQTNGSAVTINRAGVLNAQGISDTITGLIINDGIFITNGGNFTVSALTMTGGAVDSGAGTLTLAGNVTYNASSQAVLAGNLNLGAASRTFSVADGAAIDDMVINASISGAGGGIIKSGAGALELTNPNNTYTGTNNQTTLTFANTPTGGSFILTFDGATTDAIPYDTTAANLISNITSALAALPTVGSASNFSVSGTNSLITVTFQGALGGAQIPVNGSAPIAIAASALTGNGSPPSVSASNAVAGVFGTSVTAGVLDLYVDAIPGSANHVLGTGGLQINGGALWAHGADRTISNALYLAGFTNVLGGRPDLGGGFALNFSAPVNGPISANSITTIQVDNPNTDPVTGLPRPAVTISGTLGADTAGRALTKTGLGELVLSGNNRYTGSTTVSAGVLDLQHSNAAGTGVALIIVAAGAALYLDGATSNGALNIANKSVLLNGAASPGATGYLNNNYGELVNVGGNNTITTPYSINTTNVLSTNFGPAFTNIAAGSSLDLVGALVNPGLIKIGSGVLRSSGMSPNQSNVAFNILGGAYEANKTPGVTSFRTIVVGDNVTPATLKLDGNQQLSSNFTSVTVNSTGTLDASGQLATANEQQLVYLGGATGGSFTISFGGQTTSPLAFNASAKSVQLALSSLSSIGSGNVVVSNSTSTFAAPTASADTFDTAGIWGIAFTGALAGRNLNQLTLDTSAATGLTSFAVVQTLEDGAGANNSNEVQAVYGGAGGFALTFNGQTTGSIPQNAPPSTVESALTGLTNVGAGNVTVAAGAAANSYIVTFQGARGGTNQQLITVVGSAAGSGTIADGGGWNSSQHFSPPVSGTFTLSYNGNTSSSLPFNAPWQQIQKAIETLPGIGQGNVSVTADYLVSDFDLTFIGALAGTAVAPIILNTASSTPFTVTATGGGSSQVELINLAGATSGSFTLSYGGQTTAGLAFNATASQVQSALTALTNLGPASSNTVQTLTFSSGVTGGTFTLTFNGSTTVPITYSATPATTAANILSALGGLASIGPANVVVTAVDAFHFNVAFVGELGATPQFQMSGVGTSLTGTSPSLTISTTTAGSVSNIIVTNPTPGIYYVQFANALGGGVEGQIGIDPTNGGSGGLGSPANVPVSAVSVVTTCVGGSIEPVLSGAGTQATLVAGSSSSASIITGSNRLVLGGNVTVNALPGITTSSGVSISGNIALEAPYTLSTPTRLYAIVDSPAANDLTITASIVDGGALPVGFIKTGPAGAAGSRMVLNPSGTSTYSGLTTITLGALNVQAASGLGLALVGQAGTVTATSGVSVGSGVLINPANSTATNVAAALEIQGGITLTDENVLTSVSSSNYGLYSAHPTETLGVVIGSGAVRNVSGNNTWNSSLLNNAGFLLNSSAAGVYAFGSDAGTLTINGAINFTANEYKIGAGTIVFGGSTSNPGVFQTNVNEGTLVLNKAGSTVALPGAVVVGDGLGGQGADVLQMGSSAGSTQMGGAVTVNNSGRLDLNNQSQVLASTLTLGEGPLSSANVKLGTATLTLGGNVAQFVSGESPTDTPSPVTINGASGSVVALGANRTITAWKGAGNGGDLTISTPITGGFTVTKSGSGTLVLTALTAHPYSGATTVGEGILEVNGTLTSNVTVSAGGVIQGVGTLLGTLTANAASATASVAGTIIGGPAIPGTGILTVVGNVINSGIYIVRLNAPGPAGSPNYDQMNVTSGLATLSNATLNVSLPSTPPAGGNGYIIINSTQPITTTFAGQPEGSLVNINGTQYVISYRNNQVVLYPITGSAQSVDVWVTKTDGTTFAPAGTTVTYTIVVTDVGPNPVQNVSITDLLPSVLTGVTYTASASGNAFGFTTSGSVSGNLSTSIALMTSGSAVTYLVTGTVAGSATGSMTNTVFVNAPTPYSDTNSSNNSASDTDAISSLPPADLKITNAASAASYDAGTNVTYTIVVSDSGPGDVTGAIISDTFPSRLTNITYTTSSSGVASGATASGAGNISDTVNLASGSSITYTVIGTIASSAASGSLADTATVTAPTGVFDSNASNNTATATVSITTSADLQVSNSDGMDNVSQGAANSYTVIVSNGGPSDITGGTVTDTAPSLFTVTSWSATQSGGASGFSASGSGDISDTVNMPAGSTITYTITGTVSPSATQGSTLTTTASVAAPGGVNDSNSSNNIANDSDTVVAPQDVDLSIVISDNTGGTTSINQTVTYTIVVSNQSASILVKGASVFDTLQSSDFTPATVSYTAISSGGASGFTGGSGSVAGGINDNNINFPPLSSVTYTLSGTVDPSATNFVTDNATVTAPGGYNDTDTSNNSASDSVALPAAVQIEVSGPSSAIPGTSTTFTAVLSNTGDDGVHTVSVADVIPAGLTSVTYSATATGGASGFSASGTGAINDGNVFLPAGSTITYTIFGVVAPASTGNLSLTATAATPTGVPNTSANSGPYTSTSTATISLTPITDLYISMSGSDPLTVGGSDVYTIVITNSGPSAASGAALTDTFASLTDVMYTSTVLYGTASGNTQGPVASPSLSLNEVLNLGVGAIVQYTVTGTVTSGAPNTLTNTATITEAAGTTDPVPGNNSSTVTAAVVAGGGTVLSRSIFYANSFFDGRVGGTTTTPTTSDFNAIAKDKVALMPGQTASFDNYTGYTNGINGIFIDLSGAAPADLVAADFEVIVGNNSTPGTGSAPGTGWTAAPTPLITPFAGLGIAGSDRIALTWANAAIFGKWVQITVLANAHTGLGAPDVFYFGNAPADSGNSTTDARVNANDEISVRKDPHTFLNRALIADPNDYNRDSLVKADDEISARSNGTTFLSALKLIAVPGLPNTPSPSTASSAQLRSALPLSPQSLNVISQPPAVAQKSQKLKQSLVALLHLTSSFDAK